MNKDKRRLGWAIFHSALFILVWPLWQHESDLSCLSNLFSFRNSFRTADPAAEKQLTEILHRLGLDLKPPDPTAQ